MIRRFESNPLTTRARPLLFSARTAGFEPAQAEPICNAFLGIEVIIGSMTPKERSPPQLINHSRKTRIAKGSGKSIQEVNQLIKQFEQMSKMMKMMQGGKGQQMMQMMQNMQ